MIIELILTSITKQWSDITKQWPMCAHIPVYIIIILYVPVATHGHSPSDQMKTEKKKSKTKKKKKEKTSMRLGPKSAPRPITPSAAWSSWRVSTDI
jgi:uncharacterized metal-binding protein